MELTEREREILQGAARGERSKEIAARLGISIRTVGAHLASIYTKLGVDSRASAVVSLSNAACSIMIDGDKNKHFQTAPLFA